MKEQAKLESLKVVIVDEAGEKVQTVEMDDPRAGFIEQFNLQGADFKLTALVA